MEFKIENRIYPLEIIRKQNKNTYIRIKSGSIISVTTNRWITRRQIEQLLCQNIETVKKMLLKCEKEDAKKDNFYILGIVYDIIIVAGMQNIEIYQNKIYAPNTRKVELWYQKERKRIFEERLFFWYDQFEGIPLPKLKIRTMKTRWGVCNIRDHSVTLNSKLMEYDETKLDYVIIHELSHFIHFNHSKEFWNTVSQYCPNYKQVRKSLKQD